MMKALLILSFLLATSLPALANHVLCGDRDSFLQQLESRYQEAPVARGIASDGSVLELAVSDSGSWTILVTQTNGVTCVVATGQSWKDLPAVLPGEGS